mgnify:CR=1 FL=1
MILPTLQSRWHRLKTKQPLHQRHYKNETLDGGIRSGKSTLSRFFINKNVPLISADVLVKSIYSQQETRTWLAEHHSDVINPDNGTPNFRRLREKAFSDETVRKQLESWIYPRLPAAFEVAETQFKPVPWLVYEIPLLYERKMESLFDLVVFSWVPREIQKERVVGRDGSTAETVEAILNQQLPIDDKRARADLVFDNSIVRTEAEIMLAMESIWREMVVRP